MNYGCIGEHLKHSFSKEIHNALSDYDYEIREVAKEELENFAKARDFKAINVTIPYKEMIMPYLDSIDDFAKRIGAVNTVVNRDGRLYGYNTDFYGMKRLIERLGIDPRGLKAVILGTGGTSKTAAAVLQAMGAASVIRVSREGKEGAITYGELYSCHCDAELIVNTTPVGMYPNSDGCPVEPERFSRLLGVVDAVYNPIRTSLVLRAREMGIPAEGGLYMLVAQALRASEIFLDTEYSEDTPDRVYSKILSEKENITLIGMPASGKSTVGAILAQMLGRELIDTDTEVVRAKGTGIPKIFENEGEVAFRDAESAVIAEVGKRTSAVIATGGGAILRKENITQLRKNGRIYFIDRPIEALIPTPDRPLASSEEAIRRRYEERYPIYRSVCDAVIPADAEATEVALRIIKDFKNEVS